MEMSVCFMVGVSGKESYHDGSEKERGKGEYFGKRRENPSMMERSSIDELKEMLSLRSRGRSLPGLVSLGRLEVLIKKAGLEVSASNRESYHDENEGEGTIWFGSSGLVLH